MEEFSQRVHAVRRMLKPGRIDAILIQDRNSSYYLSGFPCSNSVILVTGRDAIFFTDSRYILKAQADIRHFQVEQIAQHALSHVAAIARKKRLKRIGFEESITYGQYTSLAAAFTGSDLVPAGRIVRELRLVKSPAEIRQITANQRLNQQIFSKALEAVTRNSRELDIRNHIRQQMIENNCEEAFETIIASGRNSANPHAVAGKNIVKRRNLLMFDMGVKRSHYHSDMTRTVALGDRLPAAAAKIYDVVLEAQTAALARVGPGVPCKDIDQAARTVIADAGFGDLFGHGLGHGVGLEIHEGPTLNPTSIDILQAGMVITIEPGIYMQTVGGVRIEDLVVVTENGYKNLTTLPKDLSYISV